MNIKELLLECRLLSKEAEQLRLRICELRAKKDGVRAFFIKEISAASQRDMLADAIAEIESLEGIYIRKTTELMRLKRVYEQLFDQLPDRQLRLILRLKYIDLMSWEEVAGTLEYTVRNCHALHKLALAQLQNILAQSTSTCYTSM